MIEEFKDIEARKSGVVYRSTFNQIKKLYKKNPELAGELAISAIELVLTGDISSDDDNIDMYLEVNKEVAQKNFDAYDAKVENDRRNKIAKYQLDEIAKLHMAKYTQKAIAQQLKLSQQTVSNRLSTIRKEFPELLQAENTCTNEKEFVQTGTNIQANIICTSENGVVQVENTNTNETEQFRF